MKHESSFSRLNLDRTLSSTWIEPTVLLELDWTSEALHFGFLAAVVGLK